MGNQATTDKRRNKKELRRRRSFNPNSSKIRKQIKVYDDDGNDESGDISYQERREVSPYAGKQQSQVGFKYKSIMQSQVQAEQLTGISQFRNQIVTERVKGTDGQKRLAQSKYRDDTSPLSVRNYHQSNQNNIRQLDSSRQYTQDRGLAKYKNGSKDDRSVGDIPRIKKDTSANRNEGESEVYQLGRGKGFNTDRSNYENNQRKLYHKKDERTMNNYMNVYELREDQKGKDQSEKASQKNSQDYQQYRREITKYQNDRDHRQDIDRRNGRSATFDQLISGFQRKRESPVQENNNDRQFERELLAAGNTNHEDDEEEVENYNNYQEEEQSNIVSQNDQKQEIEDLKNTSQFMAQYMLISGAFSDYEWLTSTTMLTFNQKLLQPPNKKEGVMAQTFGPEGEPDSDLGRYILYVRDLEQSSIMDIDFIHLVEIQNKKKKKKKKNLITINQNKDQDIQNYLQSKAYLPDRELANIIEQQYLEDQRKSQVARKETGRFYSGEEQVKNLYAQEGFQRNRDVDEAQRNTNNGRKNKIVEERVPPQVQNPFQRRDVMRDRSEDKKEYASDPFPRNILTQGEFSNVSSILMNGSEIDTQFDGNTPKNTKNYLEEKGKQYTKGYQRKNEGEEQINRKKNELMVNQTNQRKGGAGGYNQKIEKHHIERQKSKNSSSVSSSDHSRKLTPRETAEFVQIFEEENHEKRKIKRVNKNENNLFADIQKLKEEEEMRDEAKRRAQIQYEQEHKKQEIQDMLLVSASQYNKKNKFPESNFQAYRIQQQEIEELAEQHFQELKKQKFIRERADLYSNSTLAQHQRNALQGKYDEEQNTSHGRFKSNSRERDKDVRGKKSQKQIQYEEEQRIKQQKEYEEKWKMFDVKMKERDSKRKSTYQNEESPSQNIEAKEDQDTLELRQKLIERKIKVLEKSKEKQPQQQQQVNRYSVYTSNFYQNNEKDIVSMIMSNNGFIQPHKEAESSSENDSDDDHNDRNNQKYVQKPIKIDLKSFLKDKEEKRLMQQQQWQTSDKKLQQTQKKNERQTPTRQDKQDKQERRKKSSSSDSSEADSMLNSISHQVDSLKGRIQKDKNAGLLERAASNKAQIVQNTKSPQGSSPGIKQQKEQSLQSMQDQLFSRTSPIPTKKNPMIIIQPTQKTQNKAQTNQDNQSKLEQQQFTQGLFVRAVSEYGDDSSTSIQQKTNKPQSNSSSAESSKKNILPAQDLQDISSNSSISISQQLRERKNEFLKLQIQQQKQAQQPLLQQPSPSIKGEQVSPTQSVMSNQQTQQQPQYSAQTEQQQQPQSRKQSNQNESGIIKIQSKHSSTHQSHRNSQLFSNKPTAGVSSTAGNKYPSQQEQEKQFQITVNPPPQMNQTENSLSQSGSLSGKRLSELGHPSQPRYSFLESGKQSEKEQQSVNYAKQNQIEVARNEQKQQTSYNSVSSVSSSLKLQQQQQQKYQQQEQIQQQGFQQQQQQQQQQTLKQPPSLASLGVRQANSSVVTSEESILKDNLSPKENEQQFKGNYQQVQKQQQYQSFNEMSHLSSQEVIKQNSQTAAQEEDKEQQSSSSMQSSKSSKSKNQSDPSSLNNSGGIDFFGKPSSNPRSSQEVDFFGKDSSNNSRDDNQHDNHGRDQQNHSDNSDEGEYKEMSKITEQQKVLPHSGFDFGAFGDSSQHHSYNEEDEDAPAKIQINLDKYKRK